MYCRTVLVHAQQYNLTNNNNIIQAIDTESVESGFTGCVAGPAGLCLRVVDSDDTATTVMDALSTVGMKVLSRIVVTCQTDADRVRRIINDVKESHDDITFTPNVFVIAKEASTTKYDLALFKENDVINIASILEETLIPINTMVHNYLADMIDQFGVEDDDMFNLANDYEGGGSNNADSHSGGGGGANGSNDTNVLAVSVATGQKVACSIQHCKGKSTSDHPLLECANEGCTRKVHKECCLGRILNRNKLDFAGQLFCTKKCYDAFEKANSNAQRMAWHKDGKPGVDGKFGPSSMAILLEWWTVDGGEKYNKFRGGTENRGMTKKDMAEALAKEMNDKGVVHRRTAKQVLQQISTMEQNMRAAMDFSETETGQGLQDNDIGTYKDQVLKRCKYYYELIDIVKDRGNEAMGTYPSKCQWYARNEP